jgi:hypothetical protein
MRKEAELKARKDKINQIEGNDLKRSSLIREVKVSLFV